jgi:hypothetical protein
MRRYKAFGLSSLNKMIYNSDNNSKNQYMTNKDHHKVNMSKYYYRDL